MSISLLTTRQNGAVRDGPSDDAEFNQLIVAVNDITDTQIPGITLPSYSCPVSDEIFLSSGAPASPDEVYIVPADMTVIELTLLFTAGSASGTTTVQAWNTVAGVDTLMGTSTLSGAGDVINVTKTNNIADFPVVKGSIISFIVTGTGSQHDVTAGFNATVTLTP